MLLIEANDASFFDLAEEFGGPKPLRRCLSLMRQQGVVTVVVEELPADEVEANDQAYFESRGFVLSRARHRLSFTKTATDLVAQGEVISDDYLGYCLVNSDQVRYASADPDGALFHSINYIPEAVLPIPSNPDRLLTCGTGFRCEFLGQELSVDAALFSQQPAHIGCCAHASLLMVTAQLQAEAKLSHVDINQKAGLEFLPELACRRGLNTVEIRDVLHSLGLKTTIFSYAGPDEEDETIREQYEQLMDLLPPQQVLYYAIESGFPALLGFQAGNEGHVIPILGHVFNGDTWLAEAERDYFDLADSDAGDYAEGRTRYLRSSAWTSHFVAMDDNYGPYYDLPSYVWQHGWSFVIVVTPEDCTFDAPLVEAIAAFDLFETYHPAMSETVGAPDSAWGKRLVQHLEDKRVVLRTVWVDRDRYLEQLGAGIAEESVDTWAEASAVLADLPKGVWLVEVSIPELYTTNRMKLADIFVTRNGEELITLGIRVPGYLAMRQNGDLTIYGLPGIEHYYPLFTR